MNTYLQEILISSEPVTAYTVEMRGEKVVVDTEEGTNTIDNRMLLMVYDGNFFTITQAQIELERDFAIQNNVEDRLNTLLSSFEEE
jgi:hypothetical protein